jgi:uncharacterized membrane protein YtjA (UPF0391 family)
MLYWSALFLVIAILTAVLGFGGLMPEASGIAKVVFVLFLGLFGISLFRAAMGDDR